MQKARLQVIVVDVTRVTVALTIFYLKFVLLLKGGINIYSLIDLFISYFNWMHLHVAWATLGTNFGLHNYLGSLSDMFWSTFRFYDTLTSRATTGF